MSTGYVLFAVLATKTSSPCLHWSVLLYWILIIIISSAILTSQGLRFINLLNLRNLEKPNKQAVARHKFARVPDPSASSTITSKVSTVIGSFLTTDLASDRCRPSRVALTNESAKGGVNPAMGWIHDNALHASSTAALDFDCSARSWRYSANRCSLTWIGSRLCVTAHVFHLLDAPNPY